MKDMEQNKDYESLLEKSFYDILDHKEYIFNEIFKGGTVNNSINYPIHLKRITSNICIHGEELSSISPIEILSTNKLLKEKLIVNDIFHNNNLMLHE